jgi:quinol monooxygenase YgiN
MIVVHAAFRIDDDDRDAALSIAADVASASRAEDGNVDYRVTTDVENPEVVCFLEVWADEDALAAHQEMGHYLSFSETFPAYVAAEMGVEKYTVSDAGSLD